MQSKPDAARSFWLLAEINLDQESIIYQLEWNSGEILSDLGGDENENSKHEQWTLRGKKSVEATYIIKGQI